MSTRKTKISNQDLTLDLLNARVMHSDKYIETKVSGGANDTSVQTHNIKHLDLVFRLTADDKDLRHQLQNVDATFYIGQEVDLIVGNDKILGYADINADRYQVTSKNPARELNFIFNSTFIWVFGILAAFVAFQIMELNSNSLFRGFNMLKCLVPFVVFMTAYQVYKAMLNSKINAEIDHLMKDR